MATSNDITRYADLKARLAKLNCELLEDSSDDAARYYVRDLTRGKLVSVSQSLDDTYTWIEEEEAERADDADEREEREQPKSIAVSDAKSTSADNPDLKQLYDLQDLVCEIEHLAHDGAESSDPVQTLSVIKRLAREAVGYLGGELYDKLRRGLERGAA